MTGAMYSSIAGLKAHMQKLTVIGNNVANVNTQGYKKQRTIFRDSIYGLYSGGSNGSDVVGSMNPSQLGYGSLVASIDLDMSSSSYAPGNASDCALVGEGFFLVGNKSVANTIDPTKPETFKSLTLSRLGDFHIGADGYLVDGQGNVVYGFLNTNAGYKADPDNPTKTIPDISDQLVPIRLPNVEKIQVDAQVLNEDTGEMETKKIDKYVVRYATTLPVNETTYNANTGEYTFRATGTDAEAPGGGAAGETAAESRLTDFTQVTHTGEQTKYLESVNIESLSIDAGTGAITGIVKESGEVITIGYLAIGSVTNPNGVTHTDSSYYKCGDGAGELRVGMMGGVNDELGINYVNESIAHLFRPTTGGNGQGGNENEEPLPAGSAIFGSGNTKLMVGFLETSNVDLATEISELITTQRGYQANTRIITVTDSMLEELVNMKR